MEKAQIEKIAKEYFAKNEKTENVYILANGLVFTNEKAAKNTAIRLNLQKPFHFANNLTPAPLEELGENKADAKDEEMIGIELKADGSVNTLAKTDSKAKKGTSKPK